MLQGLLLDSKAMASKHSVSIKVYSKKLLIIKYQKDLFFCKLDTTRYSYIIGIVSISHPPFPLVPFRELPISEHRPYGSSGTNPAFSSRIGRWLRPGRSEPYILMAIITSHELAQEPIKENETTAVGRQVGPKLGSATRQGLPKYETHIVQHS